MSVITSSPYESRNLILNFHMTLFQKELADRDMDRSTLYKYFKVICLEFCLGDVFKNH